MANRIPARLTPGEGRRFGLTVGTAFLALAALSRWRGAGTVALALGGVGGILLVAGVLLPGRLGPVHAAWMRLAQIISKVTTPIVMGVLYFVVLTPTALLRRLFGGNSLRRRSSETGYWVVRSQRAADEDTMSRQF